MMRHGLRIVARIVSGGQTGADRGALDAADELGIPRGGYAPLGWRAEDGTIPALYRMGMSEARYSGYEIRTKLNVEEGDGTLILSLGPLRPGSGSAKTATIARRLGRPCLHVIVSAADDAVIRPELALADVGAARARAWIVDHRVRTLNVAGPRESVEPGIQRAARRSLTSILGRVGP